MLQMTPLTGILGATFKGVDLTRRDNSLVNEIKDALSLLEVPKTPKLKRGLPSAVIMISTNRLPRALTLRATGCSEVGYQKSKLTGQIYWEIP